MSSPQKLNPDFFLASSEGYGLDEPRKCFSLRRVAWKKRSDCLLLKIDPPLIGQKYGLGGRDIEFLIVISRYKGQTLFPITAWPVFVYVLRPLIDEQELLERPILGDAELELIAWAELYKTEDDAREKRP